MTQKRAIRVVATTARLVVGAAVAVGCVVAVTAAVALPWPQVTNEPAALEVTPTAGDATLVCTGDFRAVGRDSQQAQQMSSAGAFDLTLDSVGDRETIDLDAADLVGVSRAPQHVIVRAAEDDPLVAGAESVVLAEDDLSGYAATACGAPATESWLVGGTVQTGANDIIVLANPGDVTADVTLTVFGLEQTSTTAVVPAGQQIGILLSSIATDTQQPIVRVTAAGAPVRAVLQSSVVRTLDPSGIDVQESAGAPSSVLDFAGVQVLDESEDSALTVLRLMATDSDTQATITVSDEDGVVQTLDVPLTASTPTEVNLDGLAPGVYSVDVQATASMTGALWQATRPGAGRDYAWMTPAPEIDGDVLFAVPEGPAPRLHLVNTSEEDATVTLGALGSAAEEIVVPAGGAVLTELDEDAVYELSTSSAVHAAVLLAGTDQLAGWPVQPGAAAQTPVTVYP